MADSINPNIIRKKRKLRTAADYLSGLARGDRFILSEVLTIIENNQVDTHIIRDEILASITVNDAAHSLRHQAYVLKGAYLVTRHVCHCSPLIPMHT